jgi:hypothetical protein
MLEKQQQSLPLKHTEKVVCLMPTDYKAPMMDYPVTSKVCALHLEIPRVVYL